MAMASMLGLCRGMVQVLGGMIRLLVACMPVDVCEVIYLDPRQMQ